MTVLRTLLQGDESCLRIGLVNNMPDSALEATERQFRNLLSEAAAGTPFRLLFLSLPEVPRSPDAERRIDSSYMSIAALWGSSLDGLIVTGAEPVARNLMDEPFWDSLAQLIDWAEHNTYSSVWSCLAAQAAVLHMDGIVRRPFGEKLFGVFECARTCDHYLTSQSPDPFWMPHSRWNDIPADDLSACGYRVITRLRNGIVDTFIKQYKSLFVFFQGHPEYEPTSLLLEYRRDIRRFLSGERDSYPSIPQGYFDEAAAAALTVLRALALSDRRQASLADPHAFILTATVRNSWHLEAVQFYRNWLRYLSEQKYNGVESKQRRTEYIFENVAISTPSRLAPEVEMG
jgi:homoserine O-succinyltransferase